MTDRPALRVLLRSFLAGLVLVMLAVGLYEGFAGAKDGWGFALPPLAIVVFSIFTMVLVANVLFAIVLKRGSAARQNGPDSNVSPVRVDFEERGEIVIRRNQTFSDQNRRYTILLDANPVGEVAANGICRVPISVGGHTLSVKIDWCHSKPLQITVQKNETLTFSVINTADVSKWLPPWWYACFAPSSYLSLIRI